MERPGRFEGKLITEWVNPVWRRVHQSDPPFRYITSDGEIIQPDDGFWTDFGSVPWLVRWLIPRAVFAPIFVIHDWICAKKLYSWKKGAKILREGIYTLTCAQAPIRRRLVYVGVRIYGIVMRRR